MKALIVMWVLIIIEAVLGYQGHKLEVIMCMVGVLIIAALKDDNNTKLKQK